MDSPLAALLEFEMLHGVRHIDISAVDTGIAEGSVQEGAGGSDEGMAGQVLIVTGLLADHNDAR
jgi:hypothetical protein